MEATIERFVARAKRERCILASELDGDELVLVGVEGGGTLHRFRHVLTGRDIVVDERGVPHRWASGRWRAQKLQHAVWELEPAAMRAARGPRIRHLTLVR